MVTLGKPFIATAYIPGQEQANVEFIRRHKLGWVALEAEAQQKLLLSLTNGGPELMQIREGVESYRRWDTQSNEVIPGVVRELISGRVGR